VRALESRIEARTREARGEQGVTTLELLFVVSVLTLATSIGVAVAGEWRGRAAAMAAARLLLQQVRTARAFAVREGVQVGVVFTITAGGERVFRLHRDGNANGIRRTDVDRGVDPPLGSSLRLADWFPGSSLRVPRPLPPIEDGAAVAAGSDPIRLAGGSSILSCSPTGTLTAGTVYVAGARGEAFAVRMLGATGRLRLFEYAPHSSTWLTRW
jgi:hypothetical protein